MKNKFSFTILIIVAIIDFSASFFYYPKWKNSGTEAVISWDASGYYMYLPAIFIYKDLKKCSFQDYVLNTYHPTPDFQQAFKHPSGNFVMKYSSGQAVMLAPAFFLAHFYTKFDKRYPSDGFSLPYQFTIAMWCLCISLFGLFVLRRVLLIYFTDKVAALTVFSIALCTNYFDYVNFAGAMSHNTLFTVYALLIFATIKFYENPKFSFGFLVGALCGLATLTRPTEIISVLIPLLWGVTGIASFKQRVSFFNKHISKVLVAFLSFATIASIQLFYWNWVSGEWFVYSYQNQGFDWFSPHVFKCLFSTKAGWLLYSPVMIFSLIGFYFLRKQKSPAYVACLVFSILFTYICFSWSEWWYGWSLGQRAMIQSYPVFAFPMAMFFSWIAERKIAQKAVFSFVLFSFVYNAWLTHQCHRGGLFAGPQMNSAYFMAIFGRLNVDEQVFTLLDNKEYLNEPQNNTTLIYQNEFNTDSSKNSIWGDSLKLDKKIQLNNILQFSNEYYLDKKFKKGNWYKISADCFAKNKEWDPWKMCQFIVKFYDNQKEVKTNMIRLFRVLGENQNKNVHFFAQAPLCEFDNISIVFYNSQSEKSILVDNIKVEIVNQ